MIHKLVLVLRGMYIMRLYLEHLDFAIGQLSVVEQALELRAAARERRERQAGRTAL